MSCVGLLGGTFNPPHNGHVRLGERAREHFELDPLRVLVSASPPHKEVEVDAAVRVALARLAFPSDEVVRKLLAYAAGGEYNAGLAHLQAMHKQNYARAREFFGANRVRALDRWLPSTSR